MPHSQHALHCPAPVPSAVFTEAQAALEQVQALYEAAVTHLRDRLAAFIAGTLPPGRVRACYPVVRVRIDSVARPDSRLAYGFVAAPGLYETSLTRPDLFADYLRTQFELLLSNHGVALEVGMGEQPIPLHFSFAGQSHVEGHLSLEQRQQLCDVFDLPDLAAMDDGIANGTHETPDGEPLPLALFTAPRIDYSLHRLQHYTGTAPAHFQNFVLFTNYQFYVDEFVRLAHALMAQPLGRAGDDQPPYTAFVEPGHVITTRASATSSAQTMGHPPARLPQMPAYHLIMPDHSGITLVNICLLYTSPSPRD